MHARPVISGSGITRSETNDNRIKFLIPYAKTVTFQSSYFIRACKTWNILNDNLRDRNIGFYAFKSGLKLYYKNALSNTYNCDDPRRLSCGPTFPTFSYFFLTFLLFLLILKNCLIFLLFPTFSLKYYFYKSVWHNHRAGVSLLLENRKVVFTKVAGGQCS